MIAALYACSVVTDETCRQPNPTGRILQRLDNGLVRCRRPSDLPGNVVTGLGLTSLALEFALKDTLSNFVSGLLLLILRPFQLGDQIVIFTSRGDKQHRRSDPAGETDGPSRQYRCGCTT